MRSRGEIVLWRKLARESGKESDGSEREGRHGHEVGGNSCVCSLRRDGDRGSILKVGCNECMHGGMYNVGVGEPTQMQ